MSYDPDPRYPAVGDGPAALPWDVVGGSIARAWDRIEPRLRPARGSAELAVAAGR